LTLDVILGYSSYIMSEKYYITTPIYYINDKPHIGSTYTTVAADILARAHRLRGDKTFFLTGTDENSQKSVEAAEKIRQRSECLFG
jgi:methionyl-tRNA synthetase